MENPESAATGLLLAMMEPPATMAAEFQDWYDTEHYPERAGTDGFLTARRLICVEGWPRYLALYDLAGVGVLHGPEYAKIAGENYSRWTDRIVPRMWGHYRAEGTQIYPGRALFGAAGAASRIMIWRFTDAGAEAGGDVVRGLRAIYENRPETAQVRVFASPRDGETDYVGIVELHAPLALQPGAVEALGAAVRRLDMINAYTPYFRR